LEPGFYVVDVTTGARSPFPVPTTPGSQDLSYSPDATQIAYSAPGEGEFRQIFVMDADGSNRRQLTSLDGNAGEPAWSPDGERIVYLASPVGQGDRLEIIDIGSMGTSRLPSRADQPSVSVPSWSPDGRSIVFNATTAAGDNLVRTVDLATGDDQTVARNAVLPAWSPTDDVIAFDTYSSARLTLVRADGTGRRTIGPVWSLHANWSPDGTRIAFDAPWPDKNMCNGPTATSCSTEPPSGTYVYDIATDTTLSAGAAGSHIESWIDDRTVLVSVR
jgi:Tol biopolymer transport system component